MNRRTFVTVGATCFAMIPLPGFGLLGKHLPTKPAWLLDWIAINDGQLANYAPLKVTDATHPYAGGYRN